MIDNDGGSTKGHSFTNGSSKATGRRKGKRRPLADQRFSAYLVFGGYTTLCLALFFLFYALLLIGLFPLLYQKAPTEVPTQRGQVLRPVVQEAVQNMKNLEQEVVHHPGAATQRLAGNVASAIQQKIQSFRQSEGVTDASLLQKAVEDMEQTRKLKQLKAQKRKQAEEKNHPPPPPLAKAVAAASPNKKRPGFVVLGMHRSGTSMLSGLMVTGFGYKTGGPLIGSAFDNEKGFFELVPAVLQNDEFMNAQRIWWSAGVIGYDFQKALDDKKNGKVKFREGARALAVLNSPDKIPYLQKDPRMCITLRTWLPLLNGEPAVVFTYRHPLEVARSLQRRENSFTLEHGLRLWIVYNMRGVQNSQDLCRVTTSNEAVLANPLQEVNRLSRELTEKCHVPAPPETVLTQEDVDKFVDSNLQHAGYQKAAEQKQRKVLATHNDGACKVYEYDSDLNPKDQPRQFGLEAALYMKAMKIYCDFQSGAVYQSDYQWPDLNN